MTDKGHEVSQQVKADAAKQPIKIELTEEQLEALRSVWDAGDPEAAAQITFWVKDKPVAEMAVAGYRYRGDTCCV